MNHVMTASSAPNSLGHWWDSPVAPIVFVPALSLFRAWLAWASEWSWFATWGLTLVVAFGVTTWFWKGAKASACTMVTLLLLGGELLRWAWGWTPGVASWELAVAWICTETILVGLAWWTWKWWLRHDLGVDTMASW